jgi:hypothetical protein
MSTLLSDLQSLVARPSAPEVFSLNLRDLNFRHVVIVLLVTAVSLAAGAAAFDYGTVRRPVGVLLRGDPRVEDYRLVSVRRGAAVVELKLGRTADLRIAYEELSAGLERFLGPVTLVIEDDRSPDTVAFLHGAQFAIYEAVQNGNFIEMAGRLEELARSAGLSVRVGIDRDLLFLQVESENGYLYEVIQRHPKGGAAES